VKTKGEMHIILTHGFALFSSLKREYGFPFREKKIAACSLTGYW